MAPTNADRQNKQCVKILAETILLVKPMVPGMEMFRVPREVRVLARVGRTTPIAGTILREPRADKEPIFVIPQGLRADQARVALVAVAAPVVPDAVILPDRKADRVARVVVEAITVVAAPAAQDNLFQRRGESISPLFPLVNNSPLLSV